MHPQASYFCGGFFFYAFGKGLHILSSTVESMDLPWNTFVLVPREANPSWISRLNSIR